MVDRSAEAVERHASRARRHGAQRSVNGVYGQYGGARSQVSCVEVTAGCGRRCNLLALPNRNGDAETCDCETGNRSHERCIIEIKE